MMDSVLKNGTKIDIKALELKLGVPIIPISALRSDGMKELMEKAYEVAKTKRIGKSVLENSDMSKQFSEIVLLLKKENILNPIFQAVKLLKEMN